MSKQVLVNNCRVNWAKVHKPDDNFPPAKWSIDIYPNAEGWKVLEDAANELRQPKDGKFLHIKGSGDEKFLSVKRHVTKSDGSNNTPPRVVDATGKPFTEAIGNGSVCNVIVTVFHYDRYGGGISVQLEAVQVVNLVPYQEREQVDFDATDAGGSGPNEMPF